MTREEAINKVRQMSLPKETMDILEELVPEIAMSEDERMINELQGFLLSFGSDYFGTGEWQKFDDWLEKQKEPLTAEEKMNHPLYLEGFDVGKKVGEVVSEQKPAEWSKNDAAFLNEITDFFESKTIILHHDLDMYVHWLKSLPERFVLQPKQEWSEEDKKMLARIIERGQSQIQMFETGLLPEQIDWLKSLRPSWKPSEQEKGALRTAIYVLREERNFPKAAGHLQAILDAFEGKESRKDWKPSEQQMRYLLAVINDPNNIGAESCYLTIKSLYNDLKKLT